MEVSLWCSHMVVLGLSLSVVRRCAATGARRSLHGAAASISGCAAVEATRLVSFAQNERKLPRRDTQALVVARPRQKELGKVRIASVCLRLAYWTLMLFPVVLLSPCLLFGGSLADWWWRNAMLGSVQRCGVVATKLAQWAACRPDIFPVSACRRLESLQRSARTHAWRDSETSLRESGLWRHVSRVEPDPIGSGVMAQVHRGTLSDGREVAIKILHPGLRERLEIDLEAMSAIAKALETVLPFAMKWYAPSEAVDEFGKSLRESASMVHEFSSLKRLASHAPRGVSVPDPIAATEEVLVESFEDGEFIDLVNYTQKDKSRIARRGLRCLLKMLFVDNFAHADMHSGNLLVRKRGKRDEELILLDAGLTVELGEEQRRNFVDLFVAVVEKNGEKVGKLLVERSPDASMCRDRTAFSEDVAALVRKATSVRKLTLAELGVAQLITELLALCYVHKVKLDSTFVNVVVAVAIVEGLGRQLDPHIDLLYEAAPFVARAALRLPPRQNSAANQHGNRGRS